jgi:LuxR family transcriptional regulator
MKTDLQVVSEFSCKLQDCRNMSGAMEALAHTAQLLGFQRIAYSYLPVVRLLDGNWAPPQLLTRNFPSNWDKGWSIHAANDPYYHACFEGSLWTVWADVRTRKARLTAEELRCIRYLNGKGLVNGVTVPIHLPERDFAFVSAIDSLDGQWTATFNRSKDALFVTAHHFHRVASQKFGSFLPGKRVPRLASREIECLMWVARGKTTEDVASILNVSMETVRVHLDRARDKLRAINRANAIAKAIQLGLIDAIG